MYVRPVLRGSRSLLSSATKPTVWLNTIALLAILFLSCHCLSFLSCPAQGFYRTCLSPAYVLPKTLPARPLLVDSLTVSYLLRGCNILVVHVDRDQSSTEYHTSIRRTAHQRTCPGSPSCPLQRSSKCMSCSLVLLLAMGIQHVSLDQCAHNCRIAADD